MELDDVIREYHRDAKQGQDNQEQDPEAFQNNKPFLAKHPKGYKGTVSRLMPIADRAKGAVPVRVKVRVPGEEEGVYLKPEMGAVVSFYAAAESSM